MKNKEYVSIALTVFFSMTANTVICILSAVFFCGCSQVLSPDFSGKDKVEVSLSPEVTGIFSEAGVFPEGWELTCISSSGDRTSETSRTGNFSLNFDSNEISVVLIRPIVKTPPGLPQSALPPAGAVYPFHCGLEDGIIKQKGHMEADFIKALAAEAIKNILHGSAYGSENSLRTIRSFNWSKFDAQLRERKKPVPYPLLLDMNLFLKSFFEKNTNMYWKIKTRETNSVTVNIPEKNFQAEGRKIILLQMYPDHVLSETAENPDGNGGITSLTIQIPDGHWFFLFTGKEKPANWFSIQIQGGKIISLNTDNMNN